MSRARISHELPLGWQSSVHTLFISCHSWYQYCYATTLFYYCHVAAKGTIATQQLQPHEKETEVKDGEWKSVIP